ncbi:hypothetical protein [Catenulispora pinisilvae]|uniref:hypothetical protein n=1 Tax=Catenulispora pinisilvae TaxID=2705253 RepID=UPI001890F9A0|nr:hypothetical protein [Catenulispora pinisilvae]
MAGARGLVWDLIRTLDGAVALDRALGLDPALDPALDQARKLNRVLTFGFDGRGFDFADALDLAHDLVHNLAVDRDPALVFTRELERIPADVDKLISVLIRAQPGVLPKGESARSVAMVSLAARCVTALAVWLLPVRYRTVKAEELAAELYDIAAAGESRRQQLAHALRVLAAIVPLRRALAAGARRAAERG